MPSRLTLRHFAIVAGIGLLLTFQNCSAPVDMEGDESSYITGLPHAFDAKIDTLSYMSCSEIKTAVDKRAYFTFRAGAYNNITGGLALTPQFRTSTQYYSPTARAQVFAASDVNGNSRLNLSIRLRSNLQQIWKQDELRVGEEIESFLPPLDSSEVAGPLGASTPGQRLNYFPGPQTKRLMEASVRFYAFENIAKTTRDMLESSGDSQAAYLTVGYSDSSEEMNTTLRAPAGATPDRAYGSGFRIGFSLPSGYVSGERRVISPSDLTEVDLQTGQPYNGAWDCNTQFMVIRPEDKAAGRVICNATVDRFANATQQAELNAIRRVLRVEDWFVDVDNHCVLPKRTNDFCYGALNGRSVQYGVASCLNGPSSLCPHFVSVCIRR